MTLEDQVCSLDLAKRLKELGVKQESLFYWGNVIGGKTKAHYYTNRDFLCGYISAFTVAELGEIMKGKGMGTTAYSNIQKRWWVTGGEWDVGKQTYTWLEADEKWADVLTKMLIYLIENNLITQPL